jgi:tetratricopeptide (TPR) repeat protein
VHLLQDSAQEAAAAFKESLAIRRKLLDAKPAPAFWQRQLASTLVKLGDARLVLSEREVALELFKESLVLRRGFMVEEPDSASRKIDLLVSLTKLATAAEPRDARAALNEALEIQNGLAKAGELTARQKGWSTWIRNQLAKLPADAEAQQ